MNKSFIKVLKTDPKNSANGKVLPKPPIISINLLVIPRDMASNIELLCHESLVTKVSPYLANLSVDQTQVLVKIMI